MWHTKKSCQILPHRLWLHNAVSKCLNKAAKDSSTITLTAIFIRGNSTDAINGNFNVKHLLRKNACLLLNVLAPPLCF